MYAILNSPIRPKKGGAILKKCKNCGMIQSDDNTVCLDCSSPLGTPMSEAENAEAEIALKKQVDDITEKSDEFYVPLRDKIMGYSCIAFIVIAIVLISLANHQHGKLEPGKVTQVGSFVLPDEVNLTLPTKRMNELSDAIGCGWITILTSFLACMGLLFPRMMWFLETWKYRVHYGWDTPASHYVMLSRRISAYILFGIGSISLIYGWLLFF